MRARTIGLGLVVLVGYGCGKSTAQEKKVENAGTGAANACATPALVTLVFALGEGCDHDEDGGELARTQAGALTLPPCEEAGYGYEVTASDVSCHPQVEYWSVGNKYSLALSFEGNRVTGAGTVDGTTMHDGDPMKCAVTVTGSVQEYPGGIPPRECPDMKVNEEP